MSFDRQIDQVCPHWVVEEALYVSADRRTVRPIRPIASSDSVRVRLDGAIEVPSYGAAIPASAVGGKTGPFTIKTGVNDVLSLQVGNGSIQTVTVPAFAKMPTEKLAYLLNQSFSGVTFFAQGERIGFRTILSGPGARVFLQSTSTMGATLGLVVNREYRGKLVTPGWTLVNDPNTLNDRPTRLIVFDQALKGFGEYVEINYSTVRQECRRCGGLGVENDWRYTTAGDTVEVRDEALLIQEIQKDFYTILGSNPFHPWYGTQLIETIGQKLTAGGFIQNLIVAEIYSAFNRWQTIKKQQEENVGQEVTDREYPYRLLSCVLQQSTQDPTVIFVNIVVQNRSGQQFDLTRGLKVPGPADLLGSSQQQGLIRQSLSNYVLTG